MVGSVLFWGLALPSALSHISHKEIGPLANHHVGRLLPTSASAYWWSSALAVALGAGAAVAFAGGGPFGSGVGMEILGARILAVGAM